jgi:hypothetical protein
MCGNPLETFRIIMEVSIGFQNTKPSPNSSYQKPSRKGKGEHFH